MLFRARPVDLKLFKDDVGEGETLGLVILGSDKTHLNACYGDKKAHCVYMSCGNISKELRMKESARCWVKIAEIPVVKFLQKAHQGILTQRLYHICMDIVTDSLKKCSHSPVMMTDANGVKRLVRTILLAHLSDFPEQQLIACVSGSSSPISLAKFDNYGSAEMQEPRTAHYTRSRIRQLLRTPGINVTSFPRYKRCALLLQLNGVYRPYWRNWKYADPSVFLAPDALHQWHRFFYDHIMTWARTILGDYQLDGRYMRLQKRVGYKHFWQGFCDFGQHTCREFRELQRSFIAVIAGHDNVNDSAMLAFRGLQEFIYYAQFNSHSTTTLSKLEASLTLFHTNKKGLVDAGCRDGPQMDESFHIPKLESMKHVGRRVKLLGSLQQYSTEQIERCHISMAKQPYRATNKKNFEEQVCRYLDRHEKIELFSVYLKKEEIMENFRQLPEMPEDAMEQLTSGLQEFLPGAERNIFLSDEHQVPRNGTTAFGLTDRITYGNMRVSEVSRLYNLPALRLALHEHFQASLVENKSAGPYKLPFKWIDCWNHVRLQLHRCEFSGDEAVMPSTTVMASPPSEDFPFGHCNFVLVKNSPDLTVPGIKGKVLMP